MDDDYKFQLVLQLPGTTPQDFDVLIGVEESLADALVGTPHEVDGHDIGSGTGNIFIDTNDPIAAFTLTRKVISLADYPDLIAAYRDFEEDDFTILWPEGRLVDFNII